MKILKSDSHGYFNATIPVILNQTLLEANGSEYFQYSYSSSSVNSGFATFGGVFYYNSTNSKTSFIYADMLNVWSVAQKSSSTNRSIAIFYVGPDGTKAPSMTLYATPVTNNFQLNPPAPGTNISTKGMIDLGTYSNFSYIVIPAKVGAHNGTVFYYLSSTNSKISFINADMLDVWSVAQKSSSTNRSIAIFYVGPDGSKAPSMTGRPDMVFPY